MGYELGSSTGQEEFSEVASLTSGETNWPPKKVKGSFNVKKKKKIKIQNKKRIKTCGAGNKGSCKTAISNFQRKRQERIRRRKAGR